MATAVSSKASAYIPIHALKIKQDKVLMVMYAVANNNNIRERSEDGQYFPHSFKWFTT
jgi:hypothetical protein